MINLFKYTSHSLKIEHFFFDRFYQLADNKINTGLFICYALMQSKDSDFVSLHLESKNISGENGEMLDYTANTFNSIRSFLSFCDEKDIDKWALKFMYKNIEVCCLGSRNDSDFSITYFNSKKVDVFPFLREAENTACSLASKDKNKETMVDGT